MICNSENKFLNAIFFQLIWWATALYHEQAIFLVSALIVLHFIFLPKNRYAELLFVFTVASMGVLLDTVLVNIGFFTLESVDFFAIKLLPIWLIALWIAFACTLNHCLKWLFKNNYMAFIVGGLGGASSYVGAAKLGSLQLSFQPSMWAFIILVVIWGLMFLCIKRVQSLIDNKFLPIAKVV